MRPIASLARQRIALCVALIVVLALGRAIPAAAQATTGAISGTITDTQGGVLPGVTLTVTNADNGNVRTVVTEADGKYRTAGLPPGTL